MNKKGSAAAVSTYKDEEIKNVKSATNRNGSIKPKALSKLNNVEDSTTGKSLKKSSKIQYKRLGTEIGFRSPMFSQKSDNILDLSDVGTSVSRAFEPPGKYYTQAQICDIKKISSLQQQLKAQKILNSSLNRELDKCKEVSENKLKELKDEYESKLCRLKDEYESKLERKERVIETKNKENVNLMLKIKELETIQKSYPGKFDEKFNVHYDSNKLDNITLVNPNEKISIKEQDYEANYKRNYDENQKYIKSEFVDSLSERGSPLGQIQLSQDFNKSVKPLFQNSILQDHHYSVHHLNGKVYSDRSCSNHKSQVKLNKLKDDFLEKK